MKFLLRYAARHLYDTTDMLGAEALCLEDRLQRSLLSSGITEKFEANPQPQIRGTKEVTTRSPSTKIPFPLGTMDGY